MKKFKALAFLTALIMALSACTGKVETQNNTLQPEKEESVEVKDHPFYTKITQTDSRPIAVMIDNDDYRARPQLGLETAYLVYEILVEGGSTRFMALFMDEDMEKVGPVRSSRHYFLDYALENDAIYTHCGYSPQAARDIRTLGINNINGVTGTDSSMFWRDYTYDKTWHNLYTSLKKIKDFAKNEKGYRHTGEGTPLLNYGKQQTDEYVKSGEDATEIEINYSMYYKVNYKYDESLKKYVRSINGKPHTSQTGETLNAENIIVYKVNNYNLNDGENKGRQNIENIGSGEGWYFTQGKVENIKWEKTSRGSKTRYTFENGEELTVNPGNTYIQIMPRHQELIYTPGAESESVAE